ncbi:hypothetical protein [Dyella sp. RRB7]|uniref:hypothetical protein n=1 Tax=Dyella sp. RRB7 TaxID=2919502 RepID=UPI001FA957D2|nr:hypothetical protein [Dyella sp. RRB7]
MSEKPIEADDDRLELHRLLREMEAEAEEKPQGPVKQSDILELIKNRKKRDPHG